MRVWNRYSTLIAASLTCALGELKAQATVRSWISTQALSSRITPQPIIEFQKGKPASPGIRVDDHQQFQSILGLGCSLGHSTCESLSRLPPLVRTRLLTSLVHPDRGLGMNLMQICIPAKDHPSPPHSAFNTLLPRETDPALFSIEEDQHFLLPILNEALRLNPDLKFFASLSSRTGPTLKNGLIGRGRVNRQSTGTPIHVSHPWNSYPTGNDTIGHPQEFTSGIHGAALIISLLRDGARTYNPSVSLVGDKAGSDSVSLDCSPTRIVLNSGTSESNYTFDYYMHGQFMKFIQPGAIRIGSVGVDETAPTVAFRNPDGSMVLVAVNTRPTDVSSSLEWGEGHFDLSLPAQSIATFSWGRA